MRVLTIIGLVIALVAFATVANGQMTRVFWGSGGGDFSVSPAVFSGSIDGGDIAAGDWTVTVPDAGWPTDPVAREAYVWTTFYADNYDGTANPPVWIGYFDTDHGLPEMNGLFIDDYGNGTMTGVCTIEIQVQDTNSNGVLDADEGTNGSLSGAIIIIRDGTGIYDGQCGYGYYFGSYFSSAFWAPQTWNWGMDITLEDCSTPVDNMSWGSIKALYQ